MMPAPIKFRSLKNYPVPHVDLNGFVYWIRTDLTKLTPKERNKRLSKLKTRIEE